LAAWAAPGTIMKWAMPPVVESSVANQAMRSPGRRWVTVGTVCQGHRSRLCADVVRCDHGPTVQPRAVPPPGPHENSGGHHERRPEYRKNPHGVVPGFLLAGEDRLARGLLSRGTDLLCHAAEG
jgi:hypothetical protein